MRKYLIILFLLLSLIASGTVYYIDTAGLDDAGEDGSVGEPWLTLAYAATRATVAGDTIHVNAGTFTETVQTVLVLGVSIVGEGNTSIIHSHITTSETPTIYLYTAGALGDGNQLIRKIKMDGGSYTAWSAIRVRNRKDVVIKDCTIENFLVEGIGIANITVGSVPVNWVTGIEIYRNTITNSSKRDVPPGGWGGNIRLIGVEGTQIYDNILTIAGRTSTDDGVCIDATNGYWRDCDIYDNTIKIQPYTGEWNFATEMKWSYGGNTDERLFY
jgi:hypothetical protein